MKSNTPLQIRRGSSSATEARAAVMEIRQSILQDHPRLILFFCSAAYDLPALAAELRAAFGDTPTIGCTTAGELGVEGFTKGGITAISFGGDITAHTFTVDLADADGPVRNIADETKRLIATNPDLHSFGLLMMDGLSRMEEQLASLLYRHLPHVPVVGGSAGDDLAFLQTHVYVDGGFRTHAAVFTLFQTSLPFRMIRFTHVVSTDQTLVVTDSDPGKRVIYEINGEPAAEVYANLIGLPVDKLDGVTFSANPFVLKMGGQEYVRDVASANPDQSLTLYCVIETGVVLNLGRTVEPTASALAAFRQVRDEIGEPAVVIGCDCISRRLEFERTGLLEEMGSIMTENQVSGFSTYGEQYDGVHMNQTFTGIAIGRNHAKP